MLVFDPLCLPSSTQTRLLQVGFIIYLLWVFSPQLTLSRNPLTDMPRCCLLGVSRSFQMNSGDTASPRACVCGALVSFRESLCLDPTVAVD